jgi:hypothetical protein
MLVNRELNESEKEVIEKLRDAMHNLFHVFVQIDQHDISISDALEMIGMEVPLFAKPAVNQLSGRLKEMAEEVEPEAA